MNKKDIFYQSLFLAKSKFIEEYGYEYLNEDSFDFAFKEGWETSFKDKKEKYIYTSGQFYLSNIRSDWTIKHNLNRPLSELNIVLVRYDSYSIPQEGYRHYFNEKITKWEDKKTYLYYNEFLKIVENNDNPFNTFNVQLVNDLLIDQYSNYAFKLEITEKYND